MIRSKREWYKLQAHNIFNTTQSFSPEEFMREHTQFPDVAIFCVRNTRISGAGFICMPKLRLLKKMRHGRYTGEGWIVARKAPDHLIQVQGEYDGLCAEVTFVKMPMRFALQKERIHISRLQLMDLIGYELYKKLDEIQWYYWEGWDLKDRPVVEFSVYTQPVGVYRERMIIWEIRNY